MSKLNQYGITRNELKEWFNTLAPEQKEYSAVQLTNAYIMGFPVDEAWDFWPEFEEQDDPDFEDLFNEGVNIFNELKED